MVGLFSNGLSGDLEISNSGMSPFPLHESPDRCVRSIRANDLKTLTFHVSDGIIIFVLRLPLRHKATFFHRRFHRLFTVSFELLKIFFGDVKHPIQPGRSSPRTRVKCFPASSRKPHDQTPRKYVFDVTSVGQRSSPWTCNSMKVEIKFHLERKLHFPSAQLMLRLMHLTKVFESIEAKYCVSWLTFDVNEREYELSKLA